MKWRRKKPPNKIKLGDQTITIKPPNVHTGIRIGMLLIPYVYRLRDLDKLIVTEPSPDALTEGMRAIMALMIRFPGDLTKFVGLVVGRTPRWVAENTTATQLFEALPTIVRAAEIERLVTAVADLGLLSLEEADGRE